MIHVICGLIGAGKSTYAAKHYSYITECEGTTTKPQQIRKTLILNAAGFDVAHVTTYPTFDEMQLPNAKFYWIDSNPQQAKANILHRGRERDLADLNRVLSKNIQIHKLYTKSPIKFTVIKYGGNTDG